MKKLNVLAASLAVGLTWSVSLLVLTLFSVKTGYAEGTLAILVGVYPGYELTNQGAFLGLIMGFLDGFIGTYIVVSLYNYFAKKLK